MEEKKTMRMGDIVDVDASGALWLVLMDKTAGVQFYEWVKESEGHLSAYQSTIKKMAEAANNLKERDLKKYKEVESSFIEAQNKILRTEVTFTSPIPMFDYTYMVGLKGVTASMLLIMDQAGMIKNKPELSEKAKTSSLNAFNALTDDLLSHSKKE